MKVFASALLVLLALTLSDGYPTLKTIKDEVQRLMLLKPPTTTAKTTIATEPPFKGNTLLTPRMVAGFLGQLSYPNPAAHSTPQLFLLWPKTLV